jgi:hypothetical protein
VNTVLRNARRAGAAAMIAHRLLGEAPPACPYRPSTKSARYWHTGVTAAARFADEQLL